MDARLQGPVTMDTPLGDELRLQSMSGVEGLSLPFVFEIDALSSSPEIDPAKLLGQSVTLHLELGDVAETLRHWNGRVTRLEYVETTDDGLSLYRMTLRPWLWQLSLSADWRVFQNTSVPDLVTKIFQDRGFHDFDLALFETYEPREFVVQFGETDLQFISRLLQSEGIYYFFKHDDGKHTLVLADSPTAHEPIAGQDHLPFYREDEHRNQTMQYVRRWRTQVELEPKSYATADYDFTKPRTPLYSSASVSDDVMDTNLTVYEYPGGFTASADAMKYAALRLQQARRESFGWIGETNARNLTAAGTFHLEHHPRSDQNAQYLVTTARVSLRSTAPRSGEALARQEPFACAFTAVPSTVTFRPPLAPRTVRGPQTATVVGPEDQEIWTDKYGRVKVQFHWDREGKDDENSSCWVRVSQAWAGAGWGAQFIPRIGQEVVVDFLEGDPDRPVITGSLYNAANQPPFELPKHQTQSGIRSRSTPKGLLVNANEIRFEDRKGHEDFFVHAERTQTTVVKASQSIAIGGDRSKAVGGNENIAIMKDRMEAVKGNEHVTVDQDVSHGYVGKFTSSVGKERNTTIVGDDTLTVKGEGAHTYNKSFKTTVDTDYVVNTTNGQIVLTHGASEFSITQSEDAWIDTANAHIKLDKPGNIELGNNKAGMSLAEGGAIVIFADAADITIKRDGTTIVVKSDTITISASSKVEVKAPTATITADQSAEVSAGSSSVKLDAGGVTVTGTLIKLNS